MHPDEARTDRGCDLGRDGRYRLASPRDAALRILAARFAPQAAAPTSVPLADFQRDTVARAAAILHQRRGVLVADSVGLGKTFVGLALIEAALARGDAVLVIVPACLRRMWRAHLETVAQFERAVICSHARIPQPPTGWSRDGARFIVVDEAHAFRNPHTKRYRALRALCRRAHVVLLSATPVNNSLSDLYFLIRLFCTDTSFRDLGIGSLRAAFEAATPQDLERIRRAVMVRRTRAEARSSRPAPNARFPERVATHVVGYRLPHDVAELAGYLDSLTFPAYRLGVGERFSADVLRYGLLKRAESSVAAIRATLGRQIQFYTAAIPALERGLHLRPRTFRSWYAGNDGAVQLVLDDVVLESLGPVQAESLAAHRDELQVLAGWHDALRATKDDKLRQLEELLAARPPGVGTIVFTEFRDTALYLWRALRRRFATALIDGAGAWIGEAPAARAQVIGTFAPRANGLAAVHAREAIAVLVATDVLAEGMNLQDADAVISYDLPWNPIRLIQRAGRIDRIGSEHEVVHVYNFLPDLEFDSLLGLARRIRKKLEIVRSSVGLERAVLEPEEDFERIARAIASGNQHVWDRFEDNLEQQLRKEYARLPPAAVGVDEIPIASLVARNGDRVLVGMERGSEWQVRVFQLATGAELADADRILLRALGATTVAPVDPECTAASERCMSQFEEAAVSLASSSAPARVARLIRSRLGELPFDTASDLYRETDAVLDALAKVTDAEVELQLERLPRMRNGSLEQLLRAAKKSLSDARISRGAAAPWRMTGVIVAD